MSMDYFPIGLKVEVSYPDFKVDVTLLSDSQLKLEIREGPFARIETVDIYVIPLGNSIFAVSWREKDGATVTNVQDYDRLRVYSCTTLPDGRFLRRAGNFTITRAADQVLDNQPHRNKALVLEAMNALFQRRDASAVQRYYVPGYIQHNPVIPQGRDALKNLVADLPRDIYYEPGLIVAEGDLVAIHGRIHGWSEIPQIAADLFRIEDGRLAEHWNVLQNEVPSNSAPGRVPMFDPDERLRVQPGRHITDDAAAEARHG